MSEALVNGAAALVEPPSAEENLRKAEETLRNILECLRLQVLGNVEEVATSLGKELANVDREKIQRIKFLLDHMLKSPLQRQLNRIKSVADALADFSRSSEKSRS